MKVLVTQKTAGCNEKVEPKKLAACVLRRVSENGTLAVGRALEHLAPSGHAASPPFYPTASSLPTPSSKSTRASLESVQLLTGADTLLPLPTAIRTNSLLHSSSLDSSRSRSRSTRCITSSLILPSLRNRTSSSRSAQNTSLCSRLKAPERSS